MFRSAFLFARPSPYIDAMTQTPIIQRKLTTIMAADAANYSARMREDEVGTVQALRRSRGIFNARITERGGRIANTAGDGLIAEFPSVVEAVAAAVSIQRELEAGENLLPFRMGLHLGDVIVDGEDLLGDGVNLAARLQDMAREGGILATQQVVDHAQGRLSAEFLDMGTTTPKGYSNDISIFAIVADGVAAPLKIADLLPRTPWDDTTTPPAPVMSKRAEGYVRFRRQALIISVFTAGIDIVTGSGFGWCLWPIAAFTGILALMRTRLSEEEKSAVKTLKWNAKPKT